MARNWQSDVQRWLDAGVVESATAGRIRAFESEHSAEQGLRWPVLLAWALGGLLICAGVLLFVNAHWEELSPAARFALALLMVAVFHGAGAFLADRVEALARVFHVAGTVSLGAGIFLAGQIFHLQEHWPGGVMLWVFGAIIAWALTAWWEQAALAALLAPVWLTGEWIVATEPYRGHDLVLASGLTLLSVIYFTARQPQSDSPMRRALVWLGGLSLIPLIFYLALQRERWWWGREDTVPGEVALVGWIVAFGLPLALGNLLRKRIAWQNLAAALFVILLGTTTRAGGESFLGYAWVELGPYLLCGGASVALVWWGLHESRRERINMGLAGFALTVLTFYFSSVMDKLGRSLSLISLGALFLVLGWSLLRTRRLLLARLEKGGAS